jgi:hypothetical protein
MVTDNLTFGQSPALRTTRHLNRQAERTPESNKLVLKKVEKIMNMAVRKLVSIDPFSRMDIGHAQKINCLGQNQSLTG